MDLPGEVEVVNGHFSESVKFDLNRNNLSHYFRSLCSNCTQDEKIYEYNEDDHSIIINHVYPRSELATYRLLTESDIRVSWKLKISTGSDQVNSTVSQIIGWQNQCFGGGNYHIRIIDHKWYIWMRNIGENERDLFLNRPVIYDEWIEFTVFGKFDEENGYLSLSIKDSQSFEVFELVPSGQTYISCNLGPYLKFGSYAKVPSDLTVGVKDIKIKYENIK